MEDTTKQTLNRREMLKVLVAASGAVGAAAFLPAKWSKPAIEAGVIPAHAQSSQSPLTISNLTADVPVETPPDITGYGSFDWDDPLGAVSCGDQISASIVGCASSVSATCLGIGKNVGGLSGYLEFSFDTVCGIKGGETMCVTLKQGSRTSNQTCGPILVEATPAQ
jgi:hypothetical protein